MCSRRFIKDLEPLLERGVCTPEWFATLSKACRNSGVDRRMLAMAKGARSSQCPWMLLLRRPLMLPGLCSCTCPLASVSGTSSEMGSVLTPSEIGVADVEKRNARWAELAPTLAVRAAETAIKNWGGDKKHITHVIFHSCTGFKVS